MNVLCGKCGETDYPHVCGAVPLNGSRTWEGELLVNFWGDTSFCLDDPDNYKAENDFDEILKDLAGCRIRVRIDVLNDVREA